MAISQEEWFLKLSRFIQNWIITDDGFSEAVYQSIAKTLAEQSLNLDSNIDETFIDTAAGEYLDLHGKDRNVVRYEGESDASYRERIKLIQNTISIETLKPAVEAVLNNGEPVFIENWKYGFEGDDLFADCYDSIYISKTKRYARFTVLIPPQTGGDENLIKALIVEVLDLNKATGVFYDIRYDTL